MDPSGMQRLWEHRQSTNEDFNNLSNYFMLGQSFLLLAGIDGVKDKEPARLIVMLLGILLTVLWAYVQAKQRYLLQDLKKQCARELPEYLATRQGRQGGFWRLSNTFILAHIVPALFFAAWVTLLILRSRHG